MSNLADELCEILMLYCGETGESEGAADTLKRLVKERDEARAVATRLAVGKYLRWSDAGGPSDCAHGYALGIACRACDVEKTTRWERRGGLVSPASNKPPAE